MTVALEHSLFQLIASSINCERPFWWVSHYAYTVPWNKEPLWATTHSEAYCDLGTALEAIGTTIFDGELWDVDPTFAVTLGRALRSLGDARTVAWDSGWEKTYLYRIAIPVAVPVPTDKQITEEAVVAGITAWRKRYSAWLSMLPAMSPDLHDQFVNGVSDFNHNVLPKLLPLSAPLG